MVDKVSYLPLNRRRVSENMAQGVPVKVSTVTNAALYQGLVMDNRVKRNALLRLVQESNPSDLYVRVPFNHVEWTRLGPAELEQLYRTLLEVEDAEETL